MMVFAAGSQGHQQFLPWGVTDIVKNLRLHSIPKVEAGQSLTVSIEPDHSICSDQEDWLIPQQRCEQFEVLVHAAGTLTVNARAG
jgi:hypothetical protein